MIVDTVAGRSGVWIGCRIICPDGTNTDCFEWWHHIVPCGNKTNRTIPPIDSMPEGEEGDGSLASSEISCNIDSLPVNARKRLPFWEAENERRELASGLGRTDPDLAWCHIRDFRLRKIQLDLGLEVPKKFILAVPLLRLKLKSLSCHYIVITYTLME